MTLTSQGRNDQIGERAGNAGQCTQMPHQGPNDVIALLRERSRHLIGEAGGEWAENRSEQDIAGS